MPRPKERDTELASGVPEDLCFIRERWGQRKLELAEALQLDLSKKAFALKAGDQKIYVLDVDLTCTLLLEQVVGSKAKARKYYEVQFVETSEGPVPNWRDFFEQRGQAFDLKLDDTSTYHYHVSPAIALKNGVIEYVGFVMLCLGSKTIIMLSPYVALERCD